MKRSKKKDPWAEPQAGKKLVEVGVICLVCGQGFYGGIEEASVKCGQHSKEAHPGQGCYYAAVVEPTGYRSEDSEAVNLKAERLPSKDELLDWSKVQRRERKR